MGNSKRNTKKINPKVHERHVMIKFYVIVIIAYIGLFIMAIIQKIKELFIKS
jgi:hypothetical protein